MKVLRHGGLAVDKIADALNTEGIRPRAGARWYSTSVYRVLKASGALQRDSGVSPATQLPGQKPGYRKFREF